MSKVNWDAAAFEEKLQLVIASYKANFDKVNQGERYKWECVQWYRDHWNIEAENFAEMVESAFEKNGNLLVSAMYYPYGMLVRLAKYDPEGTRAAFRLLYDESVPLIKRYSGFRAAFEPLLKSIAAEEPNRKKNLNHYQDFRAVLVYLTCQYPEKYYFFKSRMFTTFSARVGYAEEKPRQKSATWKVESYTRMCDRILEIVKLDPELITMSKARLDETCYLDESLHLLTMDLVFYGAVYMEESDFSEYPAKTVAETQGEYWPSADIYDPGMTIENWLAALHNPTVTTLENLQMLRGMLEQGGEATCFRLTEVYGGSHTDYLFAGKQFADRVKKHFHCPDCPDKEGDKERNRVYVIPFVGRYVVENGKKHYSWKLRDELKEALLLMKNEINYGQDQTTDVKRNTILYGPPGTGKTYHTVIYAVAVIENRPLADVEKEDYAEVLERYHAYKEQKRIAFTTFHQSYGYEDFIEGIKPVIDREGDEGTEGTEVLYAVQPGVFKRFCERAILTAGKTGAFSISGINAEPKVWKVSLAGTGDNPTRQECLQNGHIRIGWDAYGKDITDETDYSDAGGRVVLNAFINKMQIGDLVLSCYSASTIDAIGVVTGEYEWHDEYPNLKRLRKVNWLVKGIREDIVELNGGRTMTLASVYQLNQVSAAEVIRLMGKYLTTDKPEVIPTQKNYVFIIDEINRGNISKIFGELITLIEDSKRLSQSEETTAILPYSGEEFGVPKNVYIIGTMNTADRSIAVIDTALRRRFTFREMMPNPKVLDGITIEDLKISDMLERMNRKIAVLYDREHTIGHAYFLPLVNDPSVEMLGEIFQNRIIPLFQEYFYEDYEKIRLVLGDSRKDKTENLQFIRAIPNDYRELFGESDLDMDESSCYEINAEAFLEIDAYRSI